MSQPFIQYRPRPEDYWRGIVMFGKNVASYKFALGRALLDLAPDSGKLVTLEELAVPYSAHICEHLRLADKQGTSPNSQFLDACRHANAGNLGQEALVGVTVRLGFNNVIDAFHVIGREDTPVRFFTDERRSKSGIRITDTFAQLKQGQQASNLSRETEARWRLVETAWELDVSRTVVMVSHDSDTEMLVTIDRSRSRRRSITGAREALSGYQKGHCFYCFRSFSLLDPEPPDVDHFFPHSLKSASFSFNVDGVWNLVLSCRSCNRGPGGKSNYIPTLKLLERLCTRNEFLISSHHPLRETLIVQTGDDETSRRGFLNRLHCEAVQVFPREWEPKETQEPLF